MQVSPVRVWVLALYHQFRGCSSVVERLLAKEKVESSNLFARFIESDRQVNNYLPVWFWRRGQVVRQGSAKPLSPVRIRSSPLYSSFWPLLLGVFCIMGACFPGLINKKKSLAFVGQELNNASLYALATKLTWRIRGQERNWHLIYPRLKADIGTWWRC